MVDGHFFSLRQEIQSVGVDPHLRQEGLAEIEPLLVADDVINLPIDLQRLLICRAYDDATRGFAIGTEPIDELLGVADGSGEANPLYIPPSQVCYTRQDGKEVSAPVVTRKGVQLIDGGLGFPRSCRGNAQYIIAAQDGINGLFLQGPQGFPPQTIDNVVL
jgi:hypothetical protein